MNKDIKRALDKMGDSADENVEVFKDLFGNIYYTDDSKQNIIQILVDSLYDEGKVFLAICSLLRAGLDVNHVDEFDYNFIQTALYAGYSENFILKIIYVASIFGININHVDSDNDTIMHTAIYSDDYVGEVINIFKLLLTLNFDFKKLDSEGRDIVAAMYYQRRDQNQFSDEQIEEVEKLFLVVDELKKYDENKEVYYKVVEDDGEPSNNPISFGR